MRLRLRLRRESEEAVLRHQTDVTQFRLQQVTANTCKPLAELTVNPFHEFGSSG
jgi:hypothetical protein